MSLFQPSILKSIKQDEALVALRWAAYQNYLAKIDFIRTVKEEKYQEGFLKDLFEACLGYKLDSTDPADFSLEREKKNETDGKKADAAIYLEGQVVGVIELKAQDTRNLDKAADQAFGYLVSNADARYVVVSNFDELRFYIDKKTAFERWSLFGLDYEGFKRLHGVLSYESIKAALPLKLKEKSASFEQEISKQLYKDFSAFRTHLFDNILQNNPSIEPSTLLRLTQKLCDRIIFILFAEDRGLLNPNTIKEIRTRHAHDIMGNPMYGYYKIYFNAINQGNEKLGIPKYNGGLFAPDALLESLVIDDAYLDMEAQKLSDYDFESDIGVNILGHIFEQSLSDLEELQADIGNIGFDKKSSKRKKEGVFYTPEYITRYIVENTLGSLCAQKKSALSLSSATPLSPANPKKLTKPEQQHRQNLLDYREWLMELKICDPACGSGAFLNQALEFLIREHTQVRDALLPYQDLTLGYEIETAILEHNLYGVDINEDACEIARLSLWLRTASRGRTLTDLSGKIKSGNSLIDDPSVDGSAFDWEAEFPEVFNGVACRSKAASSANAGDSPETPCGGFDVIIGNPPYVRQELLHVSHKEHFKTRYATYSGAADLYVFFVERGYNLLRHGGAFSYIFPNKWMRASYGEALRAWLADKQIEEIIDFGDLRVFEEATTYPLILTLSKTPPTRTFRSLQLHTLEFTDLREYVNAHHSIGEQKALHVKGWTLGDTATQALLQKIAQSGVSLGEYVQGQIYRGVLTGLNEAFVIDAATRAALIAQDGASAQIIKPFLAGRDIKRYETPQAQNYLIFTRRGIDIDAYPAIKAHLEQFKERLMPKPKGFSGTWNGRKEGSYEWYEIQDTVGYWEMFEKPKIIIPAIANKASYNFDPFGNFSNDKTSIISSSDFHLLGVLNSSVVDFYLRQIASTKQNGYFEYKPMYVEQLPIAQKKDDSIAQKVEEIILHVKQLQELKTDFTDYCTHALSIKKLTQKLQNPETQTLEELLAELKKQKADTKDISVLKSVNTLHVSMIELKTKIEQIDKTIDTLVYGLYGLSEEEIKLIEGA